MKNEDTEKKILVMQAYSRNEEIEVYVSKPKELAGWDTCTNPTWNWYNLDYRIKPSPKYIPYTMEDLDAMEYNDRIVIFPNSNETRFPIQSYALNSIMISKDNNVGWSYQYLADNATHIDGRPFCKQV